MTAAIYQGKTAKTIMLQLENPIPVIEWSSYTGRNSKTNSRKRLLNTHWFDYRKHTLMLEDCTRIGQLRGWRRDNESPSFKIFGFLQRNGFEQDVGTIDTTWHYCCLRAYHRACRKVVQLPTIRQPERTLGHEPVGEMVAVAPDVTTRKVGDRVG